jgi:hypothetical protein
LSFRAIFATLIRISEGSLYMLLRYEFSPLFCGGNEEVAPALTLSSDYLEKEPAFPLGSR